MNAYLEKRLEDLARQLAMSAEGGLLVETLAYIRKLEKELRTLKGRRFPIQDGPSIPWFVIAPHESQAKDNHGQTLERLAERGGLSCCEALAVLADRRWHWMNEETARARLMELAGLVDVPTKNGKGQ